MSPTFTGSPSAARSEPVPGHFLTTSSHQSLLASPVTGPDGFHSGLSHHTAPVPKQARPVSKFPLSPATGPRPACCPAPRGHGNDSCPGPQPSDRTLTHSLAGLAPEAKSHQGWCRSHHRLGTPAARPQPLGSRLGIKLPFLENHLPSPRQPRSPGGQLHGWTHKAVSSE